MSSFRALSPNEETTLRRIVLGTSNPEGLRDADVRRLMVLGLIEIRDGRQIVTEAGMGRYHKPPATTPDHPKPRQVKSRPSRFFGAE